MSFNQRPAPRRSESDGPHPQKVGVPEDTIKSGQIQIERKTFHLNLKENPRGRFLRITEEASGRFNSIIVPAPGLEDFKRILEEMLQLTLNAESDSAGDTAQGRV